MHVNTLAFIGGVLRQIVSDTLKSGITRACFYEPLANLQPMPTCTWVCTLSCTGRDVRRRTEGYRN